jgi:hypothetical protein
MVDARSIPYGETTASVQSDITTMQLVAISHYVRGSGIFQNIFSFLQWPGGWMSQRAVYLHPSAQLKRLHTTADCLAVLEPAVDWEAEKLYGEDGLGPFDEF